MIHEPNTIQWEPGDLVLHDCDAKKPRMLLRVLSIHCSALPVEVEYVEPNHRSFYARMDELHDPARFGVDIRTPHQRKQQGRYRATPITVKDILNEYLVANGYDGLFNEHGECGCELGDFLPCATYGIESCRPGYKVPCRCGEGCDFDIAGSKEEPRP